MQSILNRKTSTIIPLSLLVILSAIPEIYLFSRLYIGLFVYFLLFVFASKYPEKVKLSFWQTLMIGLIVIDSIFNFYNLLLVFYLIPFIVISNNSDFWARWHKIYIIANVLFFLSAVPIYFDYSFDLAVDMLKKNEEGFVGKNFYSRSILNALVITGDIHPVIFGIDVYRYCSIFIEPGIYAFISIPTIIHIFTKKEMSVLNILFLISIIFTFSITAFAVLGLILLFKLGRLTILAVISGILALLLIVGLDFELFYFKDKILGNSLSNGYKDFNLTLLDGSLNHSFGTSKSNVSIFSLLLWFPTFILGFSSPYMFIFSLKTITHFTPNILYLLWISRKR